MRIVQRLREAAKIVDRLRRFHGRYPGTASKPVRRNHNDSFWPRQCFAQLPPGAGIDVIFQHVHRAAVA